MSVNAAFALAAIATAMLLRVVLQRANKKLESGQASVADMLKGGAKTDIAGVSEEERIERREGFRFIT